MAKFQDAASVTLEMIEAIIDMKTIPNRFMTLRKLFEDEVENEKVLRILKGEKVPANRIENKERIQRLCMKEICEKLRIPEIIPELLRRNLILYREGEYLLNKARSETNFDAVVDLLLILPSRHTNWYARFMYCLITTSHEDLAVRVDGNLFRRIMAQIQGGSYSNDEDGSIISDRTIEEMSLVSGPMKTCRSYDELMKLDLTPNEGIKQHKRYCNKQAVDDSKMSEADREADTQSNSITELPKMSPSEDRVVQWVIKVSNTGSGSDSEKDVFGDNLQQARKRKASYRHRFPERTSSLVTKRNSDNQSDFLSKACEYRYQTVQVPLLQDLNNKLMYLGNPKSLLETHGFGDCSNKTSEVGSIERLCVDSHYDLNATQVDKKGDPERVIFVERRKVQRTCSITDVNSVHENEDELDRNSNKDKQKTHVIPEKGPEWQSKFPALKRAFNNANLHPAKLATLLRRHKELSSSQKLLTWMCNRAKDCNDDVSSLKYHYVLTVIQQATYSGDIDAWLDKLLSGRESDGQHAFLDRLVRHVLDKFPHKESTLAKKLQKLLKILHKGDGLASLRVLIESLSIGPLSTEKEIGGLGNNHEVNFSNGYRQSVDSAESGDMCNCESNLLELKGSLSLKTVEPGSRVYEIISNRILKPGKGGQCGCKIYAIEQIQHKTSLKRFTTMKNHLLSEAHEGPNERLLFGNDKFTEFVMEEGLGDNKGLFQRFQNKVSFYDDPLLLQQDLNMVERNPSCANCICSCRRHMYLLLCRVCLGKCFTSQSYTCRVPHHYQSVCNGYRDETTYTVSDKDQVYPEYLVMLRIENTETRCGVSETSTDKHLYGQ